MKRRFFGPRARVATLALMAIFTLVFSGGVLAQTGAPPPNTPQVTVSPCGKSSYLSTVINYGFDGYKTGYSWHMFTLPAPAQVDISNTNYAGLYVVLSLLSQNGITVKQSMNAPISQNVPAGTYYLRTDWIGTTTISPQVSIGINITAGSSMAKALDAGTFPSERTFVHQANNGASCFSSTMGNPSSEIYYSFVLTKPSTVSISHCGSGFDTYLHLLSSTGQTLATNDNDGPMCSGSTASIVKVLSEGTYYIVSEGSGNSSGTINTQLSAVPFVPLPPNISYTSPPPQPIGVPLSILPSNSGGDIDAAMRAVTLPVDMGRPQGTAIDSQGNIYAADALRNRIMKITPAGAATVFAGSGREGSADGMGEAASFSAPSALAFGPDGDIYVSDLGNGLIRKVTPSGQVSTYAGPEPYLLKNPRGLTFDRYGNLYVAEGSGNYITVVSPARAVKVYAGTGNAGMTNGSRYNATFNDPVGLAFGPNGELYVADRLNHAIRKIDQQGMVSTLVGDGTAGYVDAQGGGARFYHPNQLAVDANGTIYVADEKNNMIRSVSPTGQVATLAGNLSAISVDGLWPNIGLSLPYGLSIDKKGILYILERGSPSAIRILRPGGYRISPALPAGLTLNTETGAISGTPQEPTPRKTYTVTAGNLSGTSSTTLVLSVVNKNFLAERAQNHMATYTNKDSTLYLVDQVLQASANPYKVNTQIQYFDGLGRPLQTVAVAASPAHGDMVTPIAYDAVGREAKKYLPYVRAANNGGYRPLARTEQANFYASPTEGVQSNSSPFAHTIFEPSTLNRPVEQGAPGDVWQPVPNSNNGHTQKIAYGTNSLNEVKLWTINMDNNGATAGVFEPEKLYRTTIRDENWKDTDGRAGTTEEFKDLQGRVVLKRLWETDSRSLSTYYVYDDFGRLRYVLPPAVNENGRNIGSFTEADELFKQFMYAYHYDGYNRLTEKKLPGKDWEYMVYNRLDQVVLTQDAVQRNAGQWLFTKYDALGRSIVTGLYNNAADIVTMQTTVNAHTPLWEVRDNGNSNGEGTGYSNQAFPINNITYYHGLSYYDDYDFYNNSFGQPNGSTQVLAPKTKGLSTATRTTVLGTGTKLLSVSYYDKYGRPVQVKSRHHLDNGTDVVDNEYNFDGSLKNTVRTHTKGTNVTVVANRYQYDHAGRKTHTYQTTYGTPYTSGTEVLLSELKYNEVGQLKQKTFLNDTGAPASANKVLGTADMVENGQRKEVRASNSIVLAPGFEAKLGANFSAAISPGGYQILYTYNERGWLKSSNSPEFSFELKYNDGAYPQYNGNISGQSFTNNGSNAFIYQYDKLNRLINGTATGSMSEVLDYDLMGNIRNLDRDGAGAKTYNYTGNQLQSVTGLTGTYVYDANGNAIIDGRNGVGLSYNYLNLPISATRAATGTDPAVNIAYTYDATGAKLKKVSTTGAAVTTDYIDGIQYTNGTIDFIQTEEGIALNSGGSYSYRFNLTDHLGNVRATFKVNGSNIEVLQRDNYYAFGLRKSVNNDIGAISLQNKYLYNGKELQEELNQYDYGARFYDPTVGRWNVVDPLAELDRKTTPFAYVFNNPIRFVDPDGMFGDLYNLTGTYIGSDGVDDNKVYEVNTYSDRFLSLDESKLYVLNAKNNFSSGFDMFNVARYLGKVESVFRTGDEITDRAILSLHPALRMSVKNFVEEINGDPEFFKKIRITEGMRSIERSDALYEQGRTTPGDIVSDARGGSSFHNYGLAIDIVGITKNGKATYNFSTNERARMNMIARAVGLDWGGYWKKRPDFPHYQNNFGKSWQQLLKQYRAGNTQNGYVKLK